jgi:pilus assembly protein Flp/PilA
MLSEIWKRLSRVRTLMQEDGQDLVEYALVVALIAFAVTSSEKTLAGRISNTFINLGSELTSDTA